MTADRIKRSAQYLRSPYAQKKDLRWWTEFSTVGNGDGLGTVRRSTEIEGSTAVLTQMGWRIIHDNDQPDEFVNGSAMWEKIMSWEKLN